MEASVIISAVGIVLAVLFVVWFTYKGYSPMILAPIGGVIICVTSGLDLTTGMISDFAASYGNMSSSMLFIYLLGTMFAAVMTKSEAAYSIAEWLAKIFGQKFAAFTVMMMAGIMMIGGMSVGTYMIVFPIGMVLFSRANISKNLMVGCIIGGCWTWGNCFPFSPSNHNNIAMQILGTTPSAGLIPGLAAGLFLILANGFYLEWQGRRWARQGRGFSSWEELPEDTTEAKAKYPPVWRAWIPIIAVLVLYNAVGLHIAFCLVIGTLLEIALEFHKFLPREWFQTCQQGILDGVMPVCIIAIMSGLGGVVSQTPAYFAMLDWLETTTINPYIISFLGAALCAFCLGSATSALGIMLPAVLPLFQRYVAAGYDMGGLHRLAVVGSLSLDSLPHNGSIIAMAEQFNLTMKDTYFPVFIVSVVNVFLAGIVGTAVAMLGFT